jgi:hypothetical protein
MKDTAVVHRARRQMAEAMALLDSLLAVGATVERESLYGSAYKRLALVEAAAGREDKELEAISEMKKHYQAAEQIAGAGAPDRAGSRNRYYPTMNRIAAQLALDAGTPRATPGAAESLAAVRAAMLAAPVDFWSVVGQTELKMYGSVFAGTMAKDVAALSQEFKDHHSRVSAPKMWASVLDSASFVLLKYMKRASRAEAAAAGRLLDELAQLAGRPARFGKAVGRKQPRSRASGRKGQRQRGAIRNGE